MAQPVDHYETLGVDASADEAQIKRAYRDLAKRYHPDRVPPERSAWAREQMAEINAAYEVLGDPLRRAEYDRRCAAAPGGDRALWRAHRARERSRRAEMERWRSLGISGVAIAGVGLVLTFFWNRWVGLDSLIKQCAWGGALALSALLVYVALRLTEL